MKRLVLIFLFAASGCTLSLNGQELKNSLKCPQNMLPAQVFEGSTKLQEITLPQSLKEVGSHAFRGCIYNHRTTKTNQKYPSVNL